MSTIMIGLTIFELLYIGGIWIMVINSKYAYKHYTNRAFVLSFTVILTYIGFQFTQTETAAMIMSTIYFCAVPWLSFLVLICTREYVNLEQIKRKAVIIYIIVCLIDSFFGILNIFTHQFYTLSRCELYNSNFYYWKLLETPLFFYHYLNCLIIALQIIGTLAYKIAKAPHIYKSNYITFILSYSLVVICSIFVAAFNIPFDFSIFFYGLISDSVFLYPSAKAPRKIINESLSIVNKTGFIGICCFNKDKECIYSNNAVNKIFNIKPHTEPVVIEEYLANFLKKYRKNNNSDFSVTEDFIVNNEKQTYSIHYKDIYIENFFFTTMLRFRDVTKEMKELHEEHYKATHDELTGLYNREYFFEKTNEVLRASPAAKWLMICIDIKDFKLINEIKGEDVGDEVIKLIAESLNKNAHETSIYGRINGERFGLLMKEEHFNEEVFNESVKALSFITNDSGYRLQVNIGIYKIDFALESSLLMYDKAALSIQNSSAISQLIFYEYSPSLMQKLIEEKNLLSDFDYALKSGEFKMFLQPQIGKNGKLKGAEALVRWIPTGGSPILPAIFLPTLEESGLIHQLDTYIWEEAAKQLQKWSKTKNKDLFISVNVSAKDFYYLDIYKTFTDLVKKYQIEPKNLKIEITETVLMANINSVLNLLQKLQAEGFVIEIDDFGSKYSSLNMLKEISANVLKIDMEFLRKTENEEKGNIILKNVIEMAKMLDMQVIIEGVETEEQKELISNFKCDLIQGFFYSEPIPVIDFEQKYL